MKDVVIEKFGKGFLAVFRMSSFLVYLELKTSAKSPRNAFIISLNIFTFFSCIHSSPPGDLVCMQ